jgi:hypothetical protein
MRWVSERPGWTVNFTETDEGPGQAIASLAVELTQDELREIHSTAPRDTEAAGRIILRALTERWGDDES